MVYYWYPLSHLSERAKSCQASVGVHNGVSTAPVLPHTHNGSYTTASHEPGSSARTKGSAFSGVIWHRDCRVGGMPRRKVPDGAVGEMRRVLWHMHSDRIRVFRLNVVLWSEPSGEVQRCVSGERGLHRGGQLDRGRGRISDGCGCWCGELGLIFLGIMSWRLLWSAGLWCSSG